MISIIHNIQFTVSHITITHVLMVSSMDCIGVIYLHTILSLGLYTIQM